MSCADLRREELPYTINKLRNLRLSDYELKNLSYHERCNLLNKNALLVARHFQYKVYVFFKEIILDGLLGKTKFYTISNEFQERVTPHVHSFIWIFNAPNIENKVAYIEFGENKINKELPEHLNNLELFELFKTYQVHAHSRTCWKYNQNECRFSYGQYFTEKTIIAKPLDSKFSNDEKQKILTWIITLLRPFKSYIDSNLNPVKVIIIDPTKDNFTQPLTFNQQNSRDDYYRTWSISKDEDLQLHLKRESTSRFVNNYSDVGLKAWQANMDTQSVSNEHIGVTHMCQYF